MTRGVARIDDLIDHGGNIISASLDVYANNRRVARKDDLVNCSQHGQQVIVTASETVRANGRGVARRNDLTSCGARIITYSPDVEVDD